MVWMGLSTPTSHRSKPWTATANPIYFHFRMRLFGPAVALDAFEVRDGEPAGYQFLGDRLTRRRSAEAACAIDRENSPGLVH